MFSAKNMSTLCYVHTRRVNESLTNYFVKLMNNGTQCASPYRGLSARLV